MSSLLKLNEWSAMLQAAVAKRTSSPSKALILVPDSNSTHIPGSPSPGIDLTGEDPLEFATHVTGVKRAMPQPERSSREHQRGEQVGMPVEDLTADMAVQDQPSLQSSKDKLRCAADQFSSRTSPATEQLAFTAQVAMNSEVEPKNTSTAAASLLTPDSLNNTLPLQIGSQITEQVPRLLQAQQQMLPVSLPEIGHSLNTAHPIMVQAGPFLNPGMSKQALVSASMSNNINYRICLCKDEVTHR